MNRLRSLGSMCVLIILIKNYNVFTYRKNTKQNNKKFRKTGQGSILLKKSVYVIISYHPIPYQFLDTNSFEEVLSSCSPTVLAFVLTCELKNPKYITGSYNNSIRKGKILMVFLGFFLYYETPHCRFDLEIFHWIFLLP